MSIRFQGYSLPGERDSKGLKEGREKDGERANVSTGISNRPFRYYLLEYAVGVVRKEITSERRDGIRRFWKFLSEREVKLIGSNRRVRFELDPWQFFQITDSYRYQYRIEWYTGLNIHFSTMHS